MSKRSLISLFIGVVFCLFALTPSTSFAQSPTLIQVSENRSVATSAATNIVLNSEIKPENISNNSLELMNEQLKSQQLEIDALKEQIHKMEKMLETAVNRTSVVTSPNFTPTNSNFNPSPNPANPSIYPVPTVRPAPIARHAPSELLPDLGHIGAEVGLLVGGSQNPFKSNEGFFAGGFIDLPVKRIKGGKLSYEILIGAQRTVSTQQTTSGVIALVNSALNTALGNPPSVNNLLGPLPVTNKVRERLTVLTVVPASFKYTILSFDKQNIRPYVVAGLGTYVGLSSQKLVDFDAAKYINNPAVSSLLNALLNGAQIGGLAPIAPELRSRGVSAGQGDFRFGLNAGGGMEIRVSPRFSIGFDYRINKLEGKNGTFSTFAAKPTVHF